MSKTNKGITFKGNALTLQGTELKEGTRMPSFKLTAGDMSDLASESFNNKALIISVVPSLDTPVCSIQTKRFNQETSSLGSNVVVLTVSLDLPFAQKRWCGAEGVENVVVASDYKYREFGEKFGVHIKEWGLLSRALFVVDASGIIKHVEYVQDISNEPDYVTALTAAKTA
ncbi:MAG: thiol peroxidase [Deltaproteobacteria bacterium]|nr:thiol peroxidase [Deltaproteobacteria bacterium]